MAQGEYREIESGYGHDGFLLEVEQLTAVIVNEFWRKQEEATQSARSLAER